MTLIKLFVYGLSLMGFGFGALSAWYWWKSSRVGVRLKHDPAIYTETATAALMPGGSLHEYLSGVSALNAKAAIFGAIGVLLATIASIVGTACS